MKSKGEGGFQVTFDKGKPVYCYRVTFDYNEWTYSLNSEKPKKIPAKKKIKLERYYE